MTTGRRMGLLGGTFDPIHYGHLDLADAAQASLGLDAVTFIPALAPPHRGAPHESVFHRFALVALAIDGRAGWSVSDEELQGNGPSFTVETLRRWHARGWGPWELFFIAGADAFAGIATWHEYPRVLDAAHFAVVTRPGLDLDAAMARTPELRTRVRPDRVGASAVHGSARIPHEPVCEGAATSIFPVDAHTRDVSSTQIRARLTAGDPIGDLVPPAVERHITVHHLYGSTKR